MKSFYNKTLVLLILGQGLCVIGAASLAFLIRLGPAIPNEKTGQIFPFNTPGNTHYVTPAQALLILTLPLMVLFAFLIRRTKTRIQDENNDTSK